MMQTLDANPLTALLARCARALVLLVGSLVFTLGYFIILPLLGALGHPPEKQLELRSLDVIEAPPPPPPEAAAEQAKPQDVRPELSADLKPLNLSDLEAALNPGAGGAGDGFTVDLGKYTKGMAGQGDGVFSMADLDQKPQAIYQPAPNYPPDLQKQGVGGTVAILFVVGANGQVEDAKVESSPSPALEREALAALRKWRFEPGRRGGKPVAFRMRVPITFSPK